MSEESFPRQKPAPGTLPRSDEPARQALEHHVQLLSAAVEACLREAGGLSELELIRQLQARPWQLIGPVDYADPAALYPVHFLLFHVLYRLRDEVASSGETLTISPLAITLERDGVVAGSGLPDRTDPLRDFYLDLDQYRMAEADIHRMVDDFWAGRTRHRPGSDSAEAAAGILGFESLPPDFATVKHRFRRAVMQAHPDRGGDTGQVQQLNDAFTTLRHYFRHGEFPC
ncbi:DNA-J related domain-containing protein [Marinobacter sp.]|uniref:DNA-J related domain-containing protein n=1 Tax=Marinobacter sp. TaxID=50741 RepID=UPI00356A793B